MGKADCGVGDSIPFSLAGLGGGSASGKTTVATMIIEALDVPWVVLLSMDSFYKVRLRVVLARFVGCRGPWHNPLMGKCHVDLVTASCFSLQMVLGAGGEVAGHGGGEGRLSVGTATCTNLFSTGRC